MLAISNIIDCITLSIRQFVTQYAQIAKAVVRVGCKTARRLRRQCVAAGSRILRRENRKQLCGIYTHLTFKYSQTDNPIHYKRAKSSRFVASHSVWRRLNSSALAHYCVVVLFQVAKPVQIARRWLVRVQASLAPQAPNPNTMVSFAYLRIFKFRRFIYTILAISLTRYDSDIRSIPTLFIASHYFPLTGEQQLRMPLEGGVLKRHPNSPARTAFKTTLAKGGPLKADSIVAQLKSLLPNAKHEKETSEVIDCNTV